MLHSRLRINGWAIHVKRTYRIYREEGLMVRWRRRKKPPVPERQPLARPVQPTRRGAWTSLWSAREPQAQTGGGERLAFIYPACSERRTSPSGLHVEAARARSD